MLKPLTTSNSAHSTTQRAKRHYPPDRVSSVSDVFLVAMLSWEPSHFYFFSPLHQWRFPIRDGSPHSRLFAGPTPITHTDTLAHLDLELRVLGPKLWVGSSSNNIISFHWKIVNSAFILKETERDFFSIIVNKLCEKMYSFACQPPAT